MNRRPSPAQLELARRLLAHEEAAGGAGSATGTTAAGRVCAKLHHHLDPLLGAAGVQLLLVRSAKLRQGDHPWLADFASPDSSARLLDQLNAPGPAVTAESVVDLLGTFFALVTNFIGDRLTVQILRIAWPAIGELHGLPAGPERKE